MAVQDGFTKMVYVRALGNKSAEEVTNGFKSIREEVKFLVRLVLQIAVKNSEIQN